MCLYSYFSTFIDNYNVEVNFLTNLVTIGGVIFAAVSYYRWRHNFKAQKAHEYSLGVLKQMKLLHNSIEELRAPRFYFPERIKEEIDSLYIPAIQKLREQTISMQQDFIVAQNVLIHNKNILDEFNRLIINEIINKFTGAVYLYTRREERDFNFTDFKNSEIWKILFPAEHKDTRAAMYKRSILGTNREVIDDDFNKITEKNFQSIYAVLEKELGINETNK